MGVFYESRKAKVTKHFFEDNITQGNTKRLVITL